MARLDGKAAMVTGSGAGIGRAIAQVLGAHGAKVAVCDLNMASAEATADSVEKAGGTAIAIHTDVTQPESVQAAVNRAVKEFGFLNVAVNNAGGSVSGDDTVVDMNLDAFWQTIQVNLFGAVLGCRFAIPEIIRAGGGSVVNLASIAGAIGIPGKDAYAASKGAINSLTRSLAVTYGRQKVRVNAVAPGATLTDRIRQRPDVKEIAAQVAQNQMFGFIEPIDIANAVLYFASDESRATTGTTLLVDGGLTIT